MSERLEAIGGTLEIRSVPGEGTRVKAEVPVG
jgi:signal transduction histidine kinase